MKLLHIDSSILGDASASRDLSAAIVDGLKAAHADLQVVRRDLAAEVPAHVTLPGLASDAAREILEEFLDADVVVIGAPMYNLGIPSQLKAWIDHIVIAGRTFQYGPDGVQGLAGDKRVIVAHSRGGAYTEGTPAAAADFAVPYLRGILGFIGVRNPEFVIAEGLALGDEPRAAGLKAAHARVAELVAPERAAA